MNLRRRLILDYYVGGLLHVLLKGPTILLGKILHRDHDLKNCSDVTILKMLGGGSLAIAYPRATGAEEVVPDPPLAVTHKPRRSSLRRNAGFIR